MPARSLVRTTLALAVLGPLACAINPVHRSSDTGSSRARANVPAGLFAPGRWNAEMAGTPPANRSATVPIGGVMEFEVEVTPLRDSAQLVFLVPSYQPALGNDVDMSSPRADVLRPRPIQRANGVSRQVTRRMPTDVWIDDDVMSFSLSSAMGWQHVRCRLERNTQSSIWEGPCLANDGITAVRIMLAVPRSGAKAEG